MPRINLAEDVIIFHGLLPDQMKVVKKYLAPRKIRKGSWLMREGEEADGFFILLTGLVQVWKKAGRKGRLLGELKAGDCVGEMCLIDCQKRSASVRAVQAVSGYFFPYSAMAVLYEKHPQVYGLLLLNIARQITRRLRRISASGAPGAESSAIGEISSEEIT